MKRSFVKDKNILQHRSPGKKKQCFRAPQQNDELCTSDCMNQSNRTASGTVVSV